jgi:hypothetical protein
MYIARWHALITANLLSAIIIGYVEKREHNNILMLIMGCVVTVPL